MPGVPKELIEHSLNVYPQAVPKKQRLRRFAPDKWEAIKREIAKLLAAGFIKEVIHPEWVANPVLILKKNKEWRMCVDYTDLNKHCPKDHLIVPSLHKAIHNTYITCSKFGFQLSYRSKDLNKTSFCFYLKHSTNYTLSQHGHKIKVIEFEIKMQIQLVLHFSEFSMLSYEFSNFSMLKGRNN
jgi:hypothetical protein